MLSRRPGDAAEPRHVRVQRTMRLHPQTGLHESQGPTVRPVRRVHRRRHRRRDRTRQGRRPLLTTTTTTEQLEALGQCIPPPEHVLSVPPSGESVWAALLIPPSSDETGKRSRYPDGDPDRHRNLIVRSVAYCQPSLKCHANPFGSFCATLLTDKQINNDENIIVLLGGCNNN